MEKFYQKFAGYYDYFEAIRKKVYVVSVVFVAAFVAGFLEAGNILRAFIGFFKLHEVSVVTTSPFQFLTVATNVGLFAGIAVCTPLVIYNVYDFLKDGLTRREKKLFFTLLPAAVFLFVAGFSYSFTILYFYLNSVAAINLAFGIQNVWDVSSFIFQIITASAFLGVAFEFPVVLTFMIRIGALQVSSLRKRRWYAIAAIFIFVGFLPPPDIFSTFIQALPLVAVYELTIALNSSYKMTEMKEKIPAKGELSKSMPLNIISTSA